MAGTEMLHQNLDASENPDNEAHHDYQKTCPCPYPQDYRLYSGDLGMWKSCVTMTLEALRLLKVQKKETPSQSLPASESKDVRCGVTRGYLFRIEVNKRKDKTEQSGKPAFVFVSGSPDWAGSPGSWGNI